MNTKDYSNLTKAQLIELIHGMENSKQYGLVWDAERVPEKVVEDCKFMLPVLKEDPTKRIQTSEEDFTHILIEGDNYHALSTLNYTHAKKIDLIYIDPPYNTGTPEGQFMYNDKIVDKLDIYKHSKWLQFMDKRIEAAMNILADDGLLVCSIDDNEIAQLKLLLDKYFDENTKIVAVKMSEASGLKMGATKKAGNIPKFKEYLVFAKKTGIRGLYFDPIPKAEWDNEYNIFLENFTKENKVFIDNSSQDDIVEIDEILTKIEKKSVVSKLQELGISDDKKIIEWKFENSYRICRTVASSSVKTLADIKKKTTDQIWFSVVSNRDKLVYLVKSDYSEESTKPRVQVIFAEDNLNVHPGDFWSDIKTTGLDGEGGINFKNGKKPLALLNRVIKSIQNPNAIILDFFAGSGSTGHAVLNLNKEDGGKRQFILCTNNENKIAEEITHKRIQKVIEGYGDNQGIPANVRYYKTDFVTKTTNKSQVRIDVTWSCTEMLCIKEGIYELYKESFDWKIFKHNDKIMAIYYDFATANLSEIKHELEQLEGQKTLYQFCQNPIGFNEKETENWEDLGIKLKPIPQKILDIYSQLYK
jgi:adenine-specific DNA-methyltransferase